MSNFSVNGNINEYIFARAVEDHNIRVRASGEGSYIRSREAASLHADWLDALSRAGRTPNTVGRGTSASTLSAVLGPHLFSDEPFALGGEAASHAYMNYADGWSRITGIGIDRDSSDARRIYGQTSFPEGSMIPLSPYAEDYAGREAFFDRGGEILWADPNEFLHDAVSPDGRHALASDPAPYADASVQLYSMRFGPQGSSADYRPFAQDEDAAARDAEQWMALPLQDPSGEPVMCMTEADRAGIVPLKRFMSDSEFRRASASMRASGMRGPVSQQMMDRAVSLCDMFRTEGMDFKIEPDLRDGQLRANMGGDTYVRLIDVTSRAAGSYVGRVYHDGLAAFPGSSDRGHVFDKTETEMLVRWSLGESVERKELRNNTHRNVGTESHYIARDTGVTTRSTRFDLDEKGRFNLEVVAGFAPASDGSSSTPAVRFRTTNDHTSRHMNFESQADAEAFLRESVASARKNFADMIDIEGLIQESEEHADDPDYMPVFSGRPEVANVRIAYWNALRGNQELYRPDGARISDPQYNDGVMAELFRALSLSDDEDIEDEESGVDDYEPVDTRYDQFADSDLYSDPDPAKNVRAHLKDSMDVMFGTFEPDADGKRFSASLTAAYMGSAGMSRNRDNLVEAMRVLGFTGDELRGDDFETGLVKDRLLQFDPSTARPIGEIADEKRAQGHEQQAVYLENIGKAVADTVRTTACYLNDNDILMDDSGVIHYTARLMFGKDMNSYRTLYGEIGQVFVPDDDYVVETKYNGSQNALFSPGYTAVLQPVTDENRDDPLDSRLRVHGLMQDTVSAVRRAVRQDIMTAQGDFEHGVPEGSVFYAGSTTSINGVYRHVAKETYKVMKTPEPGKSLKDEYVSEKQSTGCSEEDISVVFRNNAGMVHLDKALAEGSSVDAEYRYDSMQQRGDSVSVHELTNDEKWGLYAETGYTNMAVPANHDPHIFDPVYTASGKSAGMTLYLVCGAGVSPDGRLIPAKEPARCPVMSTEYMQYADCSPSVRQQMGASAISTAEGINRQTGVAMMCMQGWTFNDGIVVSRKFAEDNQVIGADGNLRPLHAGDKLSTMDGNKGVISLIVDPDMPDDEAERRGIADVVKVFRDNPDLDIVQAPYSPVSRYNASGTRFALEDHKDLRLSDGSSVPGGIGFMPVCVTKHVSEEHVSGYDDEAVLHGGGRRISAQQSWMLSAKNASAMTDEIFGPNTAPMTDMREYLNVLGWDISETGVPRKGWAPQNGEERYVFDLPESVPDAVDNENIRKMFSDTVQYRGGMMELPFPLDMKSGMQTQKGENGRYLLPVMSPHLRSGRTVEEGISFSHDYNVRYEAIYGSALRYMKAQKELAAAPKGSAEAAKAKSDMEQQVRSAQKAYDFIAEDVAGRHFESKRNIVRSEILSRRMPNSATAVWTPDPTLDAETMRMSPDIAAVLGVSDGDRVLVTRDPMLRTYGMRDMKVQLDPETSCVAINPLMDLAFDGDFDGDSVGIQVMRSPEAKAEAYAKFSFEQNMLDITHKRSADDAFSITSLGAREGDYALMIDDSMDVISAERMDLERRGYDFSGVEEKFGKNSPEYRDLAAKAAADPDTLVGKRMAVERGFNDVYADTSLSDEERMARNEELTKQLSGYMREMFSSDFACEAISFLDAQSNMASIDAIVRHGAKGSVGKELEYAKYAGFECSTTEDGRYLDLSSVRDTGHTFAGPADVKQGEGAEAIKAHETGTAGKKSQDLASSLRDMGTAEELKDAPGQLARPLSAMDAALCLTYYCTQGLIQASKHDVEQAFNFEDALHTSVQDLWRGRLMAEKPEGSGHWNTVYDRKGKPVQASPEEWTDSFMKIMDTQLDIDGVNRENAQLVASALTDPDTGKMYDISSDKFIKEHVSGLDRLAYHPADWQETLEDCMKSGTSLFEGQNTAHFASAVVRKNMELLAEGRSDEMRPVMDPACGVSVKSFGAASAVEVKTAEVPGRQAVTRKEAAASCSSSLNGGRRMIDMPQGCDEDGNIIRSEEDREKCG